MQRPAAEEDLYPGHAFCDPAERMKSSKEVYMKRYSKLASSLKRGEQDMVVEDHSQHHIIDIRRAMLI